MTYFHCQISLFFSNKSPKRVYPSKFRRILSEKAVCFLFITHLTILNCFVQIKCYFILHSFGFLSLTKPVKKYFVIPNFSFHCIFITLWFLNSACFTKIRNFNKITSKVMQIWQNLINWKGTKNSGVARELKRTGPLLKYWEDHYHYT